MLGIPFPGMCTSNSGWTMMHRKKGFKAFLFAHFLTWNGLRGTAHCHKQQFSDQLRLEKRRRKGGLNPHLSMYHGPDLNWAWTYLGIKFPEGNSRCTSDRKSLRQLQRSCNMWIGMIFFNQKELFCDLLTWDRPHAKYVFFPWATAFCPSRQCSVLSWAQLPWFTYPPRITRTEMVWERCQSVASIISPQISLFSPPQSAWEYRMIYSGR